MERDNCEICHGSKGGVKGNENVVDGKIICDYCHAEQLAPAVSQPATERKRGGVSACCDLWPHCSHCSTAAELPSVTPATIEQRGDSNVRTNSEGNAQEQSNRQGCSSEDARQTMPTVPHQRGSEESAPGRVADRVRLSEVQVREGGAVAAELPREGIAAAAARCSFWR